MKDRAGRFIVNSWAVLGSVRLDMREDCVFRSLKFQVSIGDRQCRRQDELSGREENYQRPPSRRSLYYACNFIFRSC